MERKLKERLRSIRHVALDIEEFGNLLEEARQY